MAPIGAILELVDNLILSTMDNTVKISKDFLTDIHSCLQDVHEKIDFLQLESHLQQEELKQRNHHSGYVSVQNIETATHQKQVNNVTLDSYLVSNKAAVVHADVETQFALPKPIIRPWEQLVYNKHVTGLGYDKDLSFHIPDFSKPIQFQSAGFIHDSSLAPHDILASAVPDSAPLPQH